jgi:hypothetical protein
VQARDVIQDVDTFAAPDYVDGFAVTTSSAGRSAEHWARATLEGSPAAVRRLLLAGWRFGLAFRTGPYPAPDHVLGWKILSAGRERTVLAVRSTLLGEARLVFAAEPDRIAVATVCCFERPGARQIWSLVGPIHRRVLPYLLSRAASRSAAGRA